MDQNASSGKIQSLVRASEILRHVAYDGPLGITEIAHRTGLHKSTAFGLVSTLVACGFLQQSPDSGRYSVGIGLFRLGQRYHMDISEIVRPYLTDLLNEFQETVNFVVPDGDSILYLEKMESPFSLRISTYRGGKRPMYCTGAGKAILAYMPVRERERIIRETNYIRFTDNTIVDQEALRQELVRVRQLGYGVDNEEGEPDLFCMGVPILNRYGDAIAALSLSQPKSRVTAERQEKIRVRLKELGQQISRELASCDTSDLRPV